MRSVPSSPLVGPFADRLLASDLPGLDRLRRAAAVAFIVRRVDGLPSVTRIGVLLIATLVRPLLVLPAQVGVVRRLGRTRLPLFGEYPRLVRSLGYAFIWETWPDTAPDGTMAEVSPS
jgi:hypothetical protein